MSEKWSMSTGEVGFLDCGTQTAESRIGTCVCMVSVARNQMRHWGLKSKRVVENEREVTQRKGDIEERRRERRSDEERRWGEFWMNQGGRGGKTWH